MSTRSMLRVRDADNDILIYRHCDGYPGDGKTKSGILLALLEAIKYSWQCPRMEASEFAAAIVGAWKPLRLEHYRQQSFTAGKTDDEILSDFAGGNIYVEGDFAESKLHGDIEYFYEIQPDFLVGKWRVTVYEPKTDFWDKARLKNMRKKSVWLLSQKDKIEKIWPA